MTRTCSLAWQTDPKLPRSRCHFFREGDAARTVQARKIGRNVDAVSSGEPSMIAHPSAGVRLDNSIAGRGADSASFRFGETGQSPAPRIIRHPVEPISSAAEFQVRFPLGQVAALTLRQAPIRCLVETISALERPSRLPCPLAFRTRLKKSTAATNE